jgi:hypothetical protein
VQFSDAPSGPGGSMPTTSRDHQSDDRRQDQAQFNNHSGGMEPMVYQPVGRGRGRGDRDVTYGRGRGGAAWAGRGGRGRGTELPERGDVRGARHNAGAWGNRQPINDPANEAPNSLTRGKWWHDSAQSQLCCRSHDCGLKQEVPFCQGCGQHHHGREWCYKKNEEGFNATGYWCENRKGRAPLASREGRPYGTTARSNHIDADYNSGEGPPGAGLA